MKGKSLENSSKWLLSALSELESTIASEYPSQQPPQSALRGLKRIRASVQQRMRRDLVQYQLIEMMGGACERCGDRFHPSIYDFHHINPAEKEFNLNRSNFNREFSKLKSEAQKCVLVCANCHREIHTFMEKQWLKLPWNDIMEGAY